MIRVSKYPKKYASVVKCPNSMLSDVKYVLSLINDFSIKPPKNTFKVVKKSIHVVNDRDDFIKDLVSIRTEYLLYTFKR